MKSKSRRRHYPIPHSGNNSARQSNLVNSLRLPILGLWALGLVGIVVGGWFAVRVIRRPNAPTTEQRPAAESHPKSLTNQQNARDTKREADSQEFIAQVNRGQELLEQGKTDEAIHVWTQAMRLNPEEEDVHYNLGLAYSRLGKIEDAIREYKEALRIFPDYAEAHNNLGNAFLRGGQLEEARSHFEQAIKIMPDYASAHNNLGTALQKTGKTTEALSCFQEAVKLKPDYWQARFNLGMNLLQQGQPDAAKSEFEAVLRLHPDFEPAKRALQGLAQPQGEDILAHP